MFNYFDYKELDKRAEELKTEYANNFPFSHTMIDGVANDERLRLVLDSFPELPHKSWFKYDNAFEKKLAYDKIEYMPFYAKLMMLELASAPFISFLEKLTGEEALIPDPWFRGGGMHQILRGGKLDVHADFNWHPKLKLERRINVLLYLNRGWQKEWAGNLELWDKSMTKCVKSYAPDFNRMIVFTSTDASFHGHPDALNCPPDITRKSIAMYYYRAPSKEVANKHSTQYKARPWDKTSQELEEFRKKRSTFQSYK